MRTTETKNSEKKHGKWITPEDASPITKKNEAIRSIGTNGIGKMISTNRTTGPALCNNGLTMTDG